jgi:hypothetical protein
LIVFTDAPDANASALVAALRRVTRRGSHHGADGVAAGAAGGTQSAADSAAVGDAVHGDAVLRAVMAEQNIYQKRTHRHELDDDASALMSHGATPPTAHGSPHLTPDGTTHLPHRDNFLVMSAIHAILREVPAAVRVGYGGVCIRPGGASACDQPMPPLLEAGKLRLG